MISPMRRLPVHNPPNRFDVRAVSYDDGEAPVAGYELLDDQSATILSRNDSPDLGFRYTVNPYRGCAHACAYCYARPTHEYLSLGAGTDFDRKIVVKRDAPALLRRAFEKRTWRGELVLFSGVTDCYQPVEKQLRLTRDCLEVCASYKNPVGVITKAPLIERDIDVLQAIHAVTHLSVSVSIPFWAEDNARALEPNVATPARRFRTVERLARAGIAVGVNVAPVIPGVSDADIPRLVAAAKDHGAQWVNYILLRLPGAVFDVFRERLTAAMPLRANKVLARLNDAHDGKVYRSEFGVRQRGTGAYAEQIAQLFQVARARAGLTEGPMSRSEPSPFARPPRGPFSNEHAPHAQLALDFAAQHVERRP
jgi:DNA repair photolyase